jgi:Tfp pilus assembly protein PilN
MSSINLLPPQLKEDQLYARRNRALLSFTRLAVFAALFSVGVLVIQQQLLTTQVNHINSQLGDVRSQVASLAPVETRAIQDEKELNQYQRLTSGKPDWGLLLRSLGSITPKDIYITAITTPSDSKTPLKLEGSARNRTAISSFIDSMTASGFFKNVSLQSSAPDFDQANFAKYTFDIQATTTAKVDR